MFARWTYHQSRAAAAAAAEPLAADGAPFTIIDVSMHVTPHCPVITDTMINHWRNHTDDDGGGRVPILK